MSDCTCGEINARHCPVHNESELHIDSDQATEKLRMSSNKLDQFLADIERSTHKERERKMIAIIRVMAEALAQLADDYVEEHHSGDYQLIPNIAKEAQVQVRKVVGDE